MRKSPASKPAIHWTPAEPRVRDPLFALPASDDPEVTAFDLLIEDAMLRGDRAGLEQLLLDSEAMLAMLEVSR